jgi:hypothetical protein
MRKAENAKHFTPRAIRHVTVVWSNGVIAVGMAHVSVHDDLIVSSMPNYHTTNEPIAIQNRL